MSTSTFSNQQHECITNCLVGKALDGLAVGLILTNPAGKVIWINRAAKDMLSLSDNQAIGLPMTKVARDPQLTSFWQEASSCPTNLLGEISVRWPEPMELKVNATPCTAPDGEPLGRALLFCDVTKERSIQVELSQAVASKLLEMAGDQGPENAPLASLTPQELNILRMVGKGLGNQDIADETETSLSTVRSHLKNVYRKLSIKSRAEAVSYAIRHNLS